MIGKAKSCKGGGSLFRYVINDKKGYELMRNNLGGISPKEISDNMSIIQGHNQRCNNNTISIVLSPSLEDGKNLSNDKLKEITTDFLNKMNLDPNNKQFIAFVHTEKNHKHIHILMNRVNFDGSLIKDSYIGKDAQRNAHETALKHGLISAREVKIANEREREKSNLEIKKIIKIAHLTVLKEKPKNLEEYTSRMKDFGIQVKPTINRQGNIQGFRFIHEATQTDLKASEVDRKIQLHNIFTIDKSINKPIDKPNDQENTLQTDTNTMGTSVNIDALNYALSQILSSSNGESDNNTKKKKKKNGIKR